MRNNGHLTIALAGNPNSGKTTIFNNLTGSRQHVGNWPGKTVEKKEGHFTFEGKEVRIVDLPGAYSLRAYSEDEIIARDYILLEKPDTVINVIDATNLERNLYMTVQMLEMGARVVLSLNMYDEIKSRNIRLDIQALAERLNIPIVPTIAVRKEGMKELIISALADSKQGIKAPLTINYGRAAETEINKLKEHIQSIPAISDHFNARWLAIKTLEGDENILKIMGKSGSIKPLLEFKEEAENRIEDATGEDVASIFASGRYAFISEALRKTQVKQAANARKLSLSDKIDKVVTHRIWGILLFLLAMYAVFQFTFAAGAPLTEWVEVFFAWFGGVTGSAMAGVPGILSSLIVDGIIGGVGSVLVFLPNIILLFLAISVLEDSGYMARAAYIMDRFMHTLGLHGKSFIPLILGFGCNVPAIMATRTLSSRSDRLITILINPLMSCSARLPVYVLFAGALFTAYQGLVIFSLYVLGLILAVLVGLALKKFVFKRETSHFVMELPPYRLPTLRSTLTNMWDRSSSFVRKAGTIIVMVVILIWVLASLPWGVEYAGQASLLGKIGSFIAPIFTPAGFGTWEASVALMFGILAKEVVVGTLGVVYGAEEAGLTAAIAGMWTPLAAFAFMAMTLIYIPCVAAIGAIKRETNSWKWTAFSIGYSLILGWIVAVLIFQIGKLAGLG
ncbi:MAG: ferrous iron transport protein B [Dehalococcoidales bacterium]|nr:ferrous iron transport protein B [Dehalococcoidales bacterium]